MDINTRYNHHAIEGLNNERKKKRKFNISHCIPISLYQPNNQHSNKLTQNVRELNPANLPKTRSLFSCVLSRLNPHTITKHLFNNKKQTSPSLFSRVSQKKLVAAQLTGPSAVNSYSIPYKSTITADLFSSALNYFAGTVSFQIPLGKVSLDNNMVLMCGFHFDGGVPKDQSQWKPLENKIAQNGNEYQLFIQGQAQPITKTDENNGVSIFSSQDQGIKAYFNLEKEEWTIRSDIYEWTYNQISGTSQGIWMLTSLKSLNSQSINCEYQVVNGIPFPQTIADSSGNTLNFILSGTDISNVTISRPGFKTQTLTITYISVGSQRLLSTIQESGDDVALSCSYNENGCLNLITIPENQFTFDYEKMTAGQISSLQKKVYSLFQNNSQLNFGPGLGYIIVIAQNDLKQVGIDVVDPESMDVLQSSFTPCMNPFPLISTSNMAPHQISVQPHENYFIVILYYSETLLINLFSKASDNTWNTSPTVFNLPYGQVVSGESYFIHQSVQTLTRYLFDATQHQWEPQIVNFPKNGTSIYTGVPAMTTFEAGADRVVAVYDDLSLWVFDPSVSNIAPQALSNVPKGILTALAALDGMFSYQNNQDSGALIKESLSRLICINSDYLFFNTFEAISDLNDPFKTGVEIYQRQKNLSFIHLQTLQVNQKSLSDFSSEFFAKDDTEEGFTFRTSFCKTPFNNSETTEGFFQLLRRNITLLAQNQPFDSVNWSFPGIMHVDSQDTDVSYLFVVKGGPKRLNDSITTFYAQIGNDWTIITNNNSLQSDLENGRFTYQVTTDLADERNVNIQITPYKDSSCKIVIMSGSHQGEEQDQDIDWSKFLNMYQLTQTLQAGDFKSIFENLFPFPSNIMEALRDGILDLLGTVDANQNITLGASQFVLNQGQFIQNQSFNRYIQKIDENYSLVFDPNSLSYTLYQQNIQVVGFSSSKALIYKTSLDKGVIYQSGNNIQFIAIPSSGNIDLTQSVTLISYEEIDTSFSALPYYLATHSSDTTRIKLYNMDGWTASSNLENYFVSSQQHDTFFSNGSLASTALTKFDYSNGYYFGERVFFSTVTQTPQLPNSANGEKPYGYTLLHQTSLGIVSEIYDTNGILIRKDAPQNNVSLSTEATGDVTVSNSAYGMHSLLYNGEGVVIAQMTGALFEDQQGGFINFDPSNSSLWSSSGVWKIINGTINTGWGFSSLNFLSLPPSGSLTTLFSPGSWCDTYHFSTVVQMQNQASDPINSSCLTVSLINASGKIIYQTFGAVRDTKEGWQYIDANIELWKFGSGQTNPQFQIQLTLSGTEGLLIDYVQYSIVDSKFKGYWYDPILKLPSVVVNADGVIQKAIYDLMGMQIGTILSTGSLSTIQTDWSSNNRRMHPQAIARSLGTSSLKATPVISRYESWNPNTIDTLWTLDHSAWTISYGKINHSSPTSHTLVRKINSSWTSISYDFQVVAFESSAILIIQLCGQTVTFGSTSPIQIISGDTVKILNEGRRLFVWVNGQIVKEIFQNSTPTSSFSLTASGSITLFNLLEMVNPSIQMTYSLPTGQVVQTIDLESDTSVLIQSTAYDPLGRQIFSNSTQRVTDTTGNQSLFAYNAISLSSQPLACTQFKYASSSLSILASSVQPGEFSSHPTFYWQGSFVEINALSLTDVQKKILAMIGNVYSDPTLKYFLTQDSNGYHSVKILNENKLTIALYNEQYSTIIPSIGIYPKLSRQSFSYDNQNNLIETVSPKCFESPLFQSTSKSLMIRSNTYDENGILKATFDPDLGFTYLIYSSDSDLVVATLFLSISKVFGGIIASDYDTSGRIISQSFINSTDLKTVTELASIDFTTTLTDQTIQLILDNLSQDTLLQLGLTVRLIKTSDIASRVVDRNKPVNILTCQANLPPGIDSLDVQENFVYEENAFQKNISVGDGDVDTIDYVCDDKHQLVELGYPLVNNQTYSVVMDYTKQGKINRVSIIGLQSSPVVLGEFSFNSSKNIETENHLLTEIQRSYGYSNAGLLNEIDDSFFNEKLSFTSNGYADLPYFSGIVSSASFSAKWLNGMTSTLSGVQSQLIAANRQARNMTLPDAETILEQDVQTYLNLLTSCGYINSQGELLKSLKSVSAVDIPAIIDRTISDPIIEEQFTSIYGHSYRYTSDGQLMQAKYVVGEIPEGGMPRFSQLSLGLNDATWTNLINSLYVTADGYLIKSYFNEAIETDLKDYAGNISNITSLLQYYYLQNNPLTLDAFSKAFYNWQGDDGSNPVTREVNTRLSATILSLLMPYLDDSNHVTTHLFDPNLISIFQSNGMVLSTIMQKWILASCSVLGNMSLDIDVMERDPNGNLTNFYVGWVRNKMTYSSTNNQIQQFNIDSAFTKSESFNPTSITHDCFGNINQAPHKQIKSIIYDPIFNSPSLITKIDGTVIQIAYDRNGERALKIVKNGQGEEIKQIRYIRDEAGRLLVSRSLIGNTSKDTAYIYGPVGLMGFIENGLYFSVLKDHEGSIRLIVDQNKTVVAAFDYLPFGQIARSYGTSDFMFRYTGQEWDEDLGIYNYHARMYDPDLGRFYQVDPKRQYSSPYIYAGNSPVNLIDPSGEFSWNAFCGGLTSAVEIIAGVGLDVITAGELSEVAGGLIGAGVGGMVYTIEAGDNFSWHDWGEQEEIGFISGVIFAGIGGAGSAVGDAAAASAEEAGGMLASRAVQIGIKTGIETGFQATAGLVSTMASQMMTNMFNGDNIFNGMGTAAWQGAAFGAIGGAIGGGLGNTFGAAEKDVALSTSQKVMNSIKGGVIGFVSDASTRMIMNAVEGNNITSNLWQSSLQGGIGFTYAGMRSVELQNRSFISKSLKIVSINATDNCLRKSAAEDFLRNQMPDSLLTNIQSQLKALGVPEQALANPDAINAYYKQIQNLSSTIDQVKAIRDAVAIQYRSDSAAYMASKYQDPDFQAAFGEMILNCVLTQSFKGIPTLLDKVKELSETWNQSGDAGALSQSIKEYVEQNNGQAIKDYAESVGKGESWGSFLELRSSAELYNRQFKILHTNPLTGKTEWALIGDKNGEPTYLQLQNNHFDLLVKKGISFFEKIRIYKNQGLDPGLGDGTEVNDYIEELKKQNPKITSDEIKAAVIKKFEGEGGTYASLKRLYSSRQKIESDHNPPKSVYAFAKDKNIRNLTDGQMAAVTLDYQEHRDFITTGSSKVEKDFRQEQMNFFEQGNYQAAIKLNWNAYIDAGVFDNIKAGLVECLKVHVKNGLLTQTESDQMAKDYNLVKKVATVAMAILKNPSVNKVSSQNIEKHFKALSLTGTAIPQVSLPLSDITLIPNLSLGSVQIGMTRDSVKALFTETATSTNQHTLSLASDKNVTFQIPPHDYFGQSDIQVQYDAQGLVNFIEAGGASPLVFNSIKPFEVSFSSLGVFLNTLDPEVNTPQGTLNGGSFLISKKLGVSIWTNDDFNAPPYSVAVFKNGYYD